jgi:hypothetical protein
MFLQNCQDNKNFPQGPWQLFDQNCEGIVNLKVEDNGQFINESYVARVVTPDKIELLKVDEKETRCTLMGNVFVCEGKTGKVLKVSVKERIGNDDFMKAMRNAMLEYFPNETIGLGGMFILKSGKANHFVMSDFSETPIETEENLKNWLNFHEFKSPLVAVGTILVSEMKTISLITT